MEERYRTDSIINETFEPLWQQFKTGQHGKDLKRKSKQHRERTLSREYSDLMATFENLSRQRESLRQRSNKHKSLSRSIAKIRGETTPRDENFDERVEGSHLEDRKVFGIFPNLDPEKEKHANKNEPDEKSSPSDHKTKRENKKSFPPFNSDHEPNRYSRNYVSPEKDLSDLIQSFYIPPDNNHSGLSDPDMSSSRKYIPPQAQKYHRKERYKRFQKPEDTIQGISDLSEGCFGLVKYRVPKLAIDRQVERKSNGPSQSKHPPPHVLSMFPKSYRGKQKFNPKRDVRLTLNELRVKSMVVPALPEITDKPLVTNSAPVIGSKIQHHTPRTLRSKQHLPFELYDDNFSSRWFEEEEDTYSKDLNSNPRKKLVVRLPAITTDRDMTICEDDIESSPKRPCVDRTNKISYTNKYHKMNALSGAFS